MLEKREPFYTVDEDVNWCSHYEHTLLLLLLLSRFSHVWPCATSSPATHQAPLSVGFSRQEPWSWMPFLLQSTLWRLLKKLKIELLYDLVIHFRAYIQRKLIQKIEFQRIARRDEKAFLSNQCKEIEENNRMGKTRDLFKKIRDSKGTFHAKMGSIKDRNGRYLTEAEDIKKRWQEYTEELYKKDLHNPENHNGVITHLEPDIL